MGTRSKLSVLFLTKKGLIDALYDGSKFRFDVFFTCYSCRYLLQYGKNRREKRKCLGEEEWNAKNGGFLLRFGKGMPAEHTHGRRLARTIRANQANISPDRTSRFRRSTASHRPRSGLRLSVFIAGIFFLFTAENAETAEK